VHEHLERDALGARASNQRSRRVEISRVTRVGTSARRRDGAIRLMRPACSRSRRGCRADARRVRRRSSTWTKRSWVEPPTRAQSALRAERWESGSSTTGLRRLRRRCLRAVRGFARPDLQDADVRGRLGAHQRLSSWDGERVEGGLDGDARRLGDAARPAHAWGGRFALHPPLRDLRSLRCAPVTRWEAVAGLQPRSVAHWARARVRRRARSAAALMRHSRGKTSMVGGQARGARKSESQQQSCELRHAHRSFLS
jgi:hypothetical protein